MRKIKYVLFLETYNNEEKQYIEQGHIMIRNHFKFKDKDLNYFFIGQLSHL